MPAQIGSVQSFQDGLWTAAWPNGITDSERVNEGAYVVPPVFEPFYHAAITNAGTATDEEMAAAGWSLVGTTDTTVTVAFAGQYPGPDGSPRDSVTEITYEKNTSIPLSSVTTIDAEVVSSTTIVD